MTAAQKKQVFRAHMAARRIARWEPGLGVLARILVAVLVMVSAAVC